MFPSSKTMPSPGGVRVRVYVSDFAGKFILKPKLKRLNFFCAALVDS